jgi:phospholipase/carboxylesterase
MKTKLVIALSAALLSAAGCDRNVNNQASSMTLNSTNTTKSVPAQTGTSTSASATETVRAAHDQGRIGARPTGASGSTAPIGEQRLGLRQGRDGLLYVPAKYRADKPAPLVVLLHGAGGNAWNTIGILRHLADETGTILLVPESKAATWDVIADEYGVDVELIDRALALTFSRYSVDPARIAISGFSDGASYALSLGLSNGDLFRHILAFSPGFAAPAERNGMPRIFISHGDDDTVLPVDRCSRRIVAKLKASGYEYLYREFDGPHTVPQEIAREAVNWLIASK